MVNDTRSAVWQNIVRRFVCSFVTCALVMPLAFVMVVLPSITPFIGGDAPQAQAATVHGKACSSLTDADTQLQVTEAPGNDVPLRVEYRFRDKGNGACEELIEIMPSGNKRTNGWLQFGLKNMAKADIHKTEWLSVGGGGGGGASTSSHAGGGGGGGVIDIAGDNYKNDSNVAQAVRNNLSSDVVIPANLDQANNADAISLGGRAGKVGTDYGRGSGVGDPGNRNRIADMVDRFYIVAPAAGLEFGQNGGRPSGSPSQCTNDCALYSAARNYLWYFGGSGSPNDTNCTSIVAPSGYSTGTDAISFNNWNMPKNIGKNQCGFSSDDGGPSSSNSGVLISSASPGYAGNVGVAPIVYSDNDGNTNNQQAGPYPSTTALYDALSDTQGALHAIIPCGVFTRINGVNTGAVPFAKSDCQQEKGYGLTVPYGGRGFSTNFFNSYPSAFMYPPQTHYEPRYFGEGGSGGMFIGGSGNIPFLLMKYQHTSDYWSDARMQSAATRYNGGAAALAKSSLVSINPQISAGDGGSNNSIGSENFWLACKNADAFANDQAVYFTGSGGGGGANGSDGCDGSPGFIAIKFEMLKDSILTIGAHTYNSGIYNNYTSETYNVVLSANDGLTANQYQGANVRSISISDTTGFQLVDCPGQASGTYDGTSSPFNISSGATNSNCKLRTKTGLQKGPYNTVLNVCYANITGQYSSQNCTSRAYSFTVTAPILELNPVNATTGVLQYDSSSLVAYQDRAPMTVRLKVKNTGDYQASQLVISHDNAIYFELVSGSTTVDTCTTSLSAGSEYLDCTLQPKMNVPMGVYVDNVTVRDAYTGVTAANFAYRMVINAADININPVVFPQKAVGYDVHENWGTQYITIFNTPFSQADTNVKYRSSNTVDFVMTCAPAAAGAETTNPTPANDFTGIADGAGTTPGTAPNDSIWATSSYSYLVMPSYQVTKCKISPRPGLVRGSYSTVLSAIDDQLDIIKQTVVTFDVIGADVRVKVPVLSTQDYGYGQQGWSPIVISNLGTAPAVLDTIEISDVDSFELNCNYKQSGYITDTYGKTMGAITDGDPLTVFHLSNVAPENENTDCAIRPKQGLSKGNYISSVTIQFSNYQDYVREFVSFRVGSSNMAVSAPAFNDKTVGYTHTTATPVGNQIQKRPVVVTNAGDIDMNTVNLTLPVDSPFEVVDNPQNQTLAAGASTQAWTIIPKLGLSRGLYVSTIKVTYKVNTSADIYEATTDVMFRVLAADIQVSVVSFGTMSVGYTVGDVGTTGVKHVAASPLNIQNLGDDIGTVTNIFLGNTNDFEFSAQCNNVSQVGVDIPAYDAWRECNIRPKVGLLAGYYTAMIQVEYYDSAGIMHQTNAMVGFTVEDLDVTFTLPTFAPATIGYQIGSSAGEVPTGPITFLNNGSSDTSVAGTNIVQVSISGTSYYDITCTPDISVSAPITISAGGMNNTRCTIAPKHGLNVGTYVQNVEVKLANGDVVVKPVTFQVIGSNLKLTPPTFNDEILEYPNYKDDGTADHNPIDPNDAKPITIENLADSTISVDVTIPAANQLQWYLLPGNATIPANSTDTSWKIFPRNGLNPGTYVVNITVSVNNQQFFQTTASFTVLVPTIWTSVPTFKEVNVGYHSSDILMSDQQTTASTTGCNALDPTDPNAEGNLPECGRGLGTIVLINNGDADAENVTIRATNADISGAGIANDSNAFTITQGVTTVGKRSVDHSWNIMPKAGLRQGVYYATLELIYGPGGKVRNTLMVEFRVLGVQINVIANNFADVNPGYHDPVTPLLISNTGNIASKAYIELSNRNEFSLKAMYDENGDGVIDDVDTNLACGTPTAPIDLAPGKMRPDAGANPGDSLYPYPKGGCEVHAVNDLHSGSYMTLVRLVDVASGEIVEKIVRLNVVGANLRITVPEFRNENRGYRTYDDPSSAKILSILNVDENVDAKIVKSEVIWTGGDITLTTGLVVPNPYEIIDPDCTANPVLCQIAVGQVNNNFRVKPRADLPDGEYSALLKFEDESGLFATARISFVVSGPDLTVSVTPFGVVIPGVAGINQVNITVENAGKADSTQTVVTATNAGSGQDFELLGPFQVPEHPGNCVDPIDLNEPQGKCNTNASTLIKYGSTVTGMWKLKYRPGIVPGMHTSIVRVCDLYSNECDETEVVLEVAGNAVSVSVPSLAPSVIGFSSVDITSESNIDYRSTLDGYASVTHIAGRAGKFPAVPVTILNSGTQDAVTSTTIDNTMHFDVGIFVMKQDGTIYCDSSRHSTDGVTDHVVPGVTQGSGAVNTDSEICVMPKTDLQRGTYHVTLKVADTTTGYSVETMISFKVIQPLFEPSDVKLTTSSVGYNPGSAAKSVQIANTGDADAVYDLQVASPEEFEATSTSGVIGAGQTANNITLQPRSGLKSGTYTSLVTVTYAAVINNNYALFSQANSLRALGITTLADAKVAQPNLQTWRTTFLATFMVQEPIVSLNVPEFPFEIEGYERESLTNIDINNQGASDAHISSIVSDNDEFTVHSGASTVPHHATDNSWGVSVAKGLAPGDHTATLTMKYDDGQSISATAFFRVVSIEEFRGAIESPSLEEFNNLADTLGLSVAQINDALDSMDSRIDNGLGRFPWWVIILIIVGILGAAAAAGIGIFRERKKRIAGIANDANPGFASRVANIASSDSGHELGV